MNTIAPNIAIPIVKPIALETLNTRDSKSVSGMIGSVARRSCQTNATRSTTPTTASARIVPEPQRYSFPPQVVTRISALTAPARSAAPT